MAANNQGPPPYPIGQPGPPSPRYILAPSTTNPPSDTFKQRYETYITTSTVDNLRELLVKANTARIAEINRVCTDMLIRVHIHVALAIPGAWAAAGGTPCDLVIFNPHCPMVPPYVTAENLPTLLEHAGWFWSVRPEKKFSIRDIPPAVRKALPVNNSVTAPNFPPDEGYQER